MLFALLVIVAGSLILASWIQVLATRAYFTAGATDMQRQRIATANGRMLLRQCLLQNLPAGTLPSASVTLPGNWGGFSVGASSGWLAGETPQVAINAFSPLERNGYAQTLTANVSSGNQSFAWAVRLRSASPIYGGLPLVLHNSGGTANDKVSVASTSVVWPTSTAIEPGSVTYIAPGARSAIAARGAQLAEFPWVPLTSGIAGTDNYGGFLALTPRTFNQISDDPTTTADGIQVTDSGSQRTIRLDLQLVNLFSAGSIPADARIHFIVNPGVIPLITTIQLNLVGGSDSTLPPLHIIYTTGGGGPDLTRVQLTGNNNRPVYLSIVKNTDTQFVNSAANTFRMGILLQGSRAQINASGTITLQGGIRSNADVVVNSGLVSIQEDSAPAGLSSMGDRLYWVEENRVP